MTENTATPQEATIEKHIQNRLNRIAKIEEEEIPRRLVAKDRYMGDATRITEKQAAETLRYEKNKARLEAELERVEKQVVANRNRSKKIQEDLRTREKNANLMVEKVDAKIEFLNSEIARLKALNAIGEAKIIEIRNAKEEADVHIGGTES